MARDKGLISDRLSIVDSTHVKANVDIFKMNSNPDGSLDKDTRYSYKSKNKPFFGYKVHTSLDSDGELITRVETTPGNTFDGKEFPRLVESKSKMNRPPTQYEKTC